MDQKIFQVGDLVDFYTAQGWVPGTILEVIERNGENYYKVQIEGGIEIVPKRGIKMLGVEYGS